MRKTTPRRRTLRRAILATVIAAAAAAPAQSQQTVDIPAEDRPLSPVMEEIYRVGAFDGADWETFGDIRGLAFDDAGNLYVFDAQAGTIVKVDPSGRHLGNVGKPGEGPGELRQPGAFTVFRDGRVVVADLGHRAYVVYRPDGSFERAVSMGDGNVIRIGDIYPDPARNALVMGGTGNIVMSMNRGGPGGGPAEIPTNRPIERLDLSGASVASTVVAEAWAPERNSSPAQVQAGGVRLSMMGGPRTFEPGLHLAVQPDGGVAYADTATWRIRIVGSDGATRRTIRRPMTPRPVTPAMQEAEKARRLAELESGDGPQLRMMVTGPGGGARALGGDAIKDVMRQRIEAMEFYPVLPVIQEMRGGWNGKLWVERRGPDPVGPGPIDVVTPEGRYAGTFRADQMRIPDAFGPDGLAAWIKRDELDVPTVVVKRLPAVLR